MASQPPSQRPVTGPIGPQQSIPTRTSTDVTRQKTQEYATHRFSPQQVKAMEPQRSLFGRTTHSQFLEEALQMQRSPDPQVRQEGLVRERDYYQYLLSIPNTAEHVKKDYEARIMNLNIRIGSRPPQALLSTAPRYVSGALTSFDKQQQATDMEAQAVSDGFVSKGRIFKKASSDSFMQHVEQLLDSENPALISRGQQLLSEYFEYLLDKHKGDLSRPQRDLLRAHADMLQKALKQDATDHVLQEAEIIKAMWQQVRQDKGSPLGIGGPLNKLFRFYNDPGYRATAHNIRHAYLHMLQHHPLSKEHLAAIAQQQAAFDQDYNQWHALVEQEFRAPRNGPIHQMFIGWTQEDKPLLQQLDGYRMYRDYCLELENRQMTTEAHSQNENNIATCNQKINRLTALIWQEFERFFTQDEFNQQIQINLKQKNPLQLSQGPIFEKINILSSQGKDLEMHQLHLAYYKALLLTPLGAYHHKEINQLILSEEKACVEHAMTHNQLLKAKEFLLTHYKRILNTASTAEREGYIKAQIELLERPSSTQDIEEKIKAEDRAVIVWLQAQEDMQRGTAAAPDGAVMKELKQLNEQGTPQNLESARVLTQDYVAELESRPDTAKYASAIRALKGTLNPEPSYTGPSPIPQQPSSDQAIELAQIQFTFDQAGWHSKGPLARIHPSSPLATATAPHLEALRKQALHAPAMHAQAVHDGYIPGRKSPSNDAFAKTIEAQLSSADPQVQNEGKRAIREYYQYLVSPAMKDRLPTATVAFIEGRIRASHQHRQKGLDLLALRWQQTRHDVRHDSLKQEGPLYIKYQELMSSSDPTDKEEGRQLLKNYIKTVQHHPLLKRHTRSIARLEKMIGPPYPPLSTQHQWIQGWIDRQRASDQRLEAGSQDAHLKDRADALKASTTSNHRLEGFLMLRNYYRVTLPSDNPALQTEEIEYALFQMGQPNGIKTLVEEQLIHDKLGLHSKGPIMQLQSNPPGNIDLAPLTQAYAATQIPGGLSIQEAMEFQAAYDGYARGTRKNDFGSFVLQQSRTSEKIAGSFLLPYYEHLQKKQLPPQQKALLAIRIREFKSRSPIPLRMWLQFQEDSRRGATFFQEGPLRTQYNILKGQGKYREAADLLNDYRRELTTLHPTWSKAHPEAVVQLEAMDKELQLQIKKMDEKTKYNQTEKRAKKAEYDQAVAQLSDAQGWNTNFQMQLAADQGILLSKTGPLRRWLDSSPVGDPRVLQERSQTVTLYLLGLESLGLHLGREQEIKDWKQWVQDIQAGKTPPFPKEPTTTDRMPMSLADELLLDTINFENLNEAALLLKQHYESLLSTTPTDDPRHNLLASHLNAINRHLRQPLSTHYLPIVSLWEQAQFDIHSGGELFTEDGPLHRAYTQEVDEVKQFDMLNDYIVFLESLFPEWAKTRSSDMEGLKEMQVILQQLPLAPPTGPVSP